MARLALGALVALLVRVAACPRRSRLTAKHEVVASTPSDYTGIDRPIELPALSIACADEILFDTDARIARFSVVAPTGRTAPRLRVEAHGYDRGPYRSAYEYTRDVPG